MNIYKTFLIINSHFFIIKTGSISYIKRGGFFKDVLETYVDTFMLRANTQTNHEFF